MSTQHDVKIWEDGESALYGPDAIGELRTPTQRTHTCTFCRQESGTYYLQYWCSKECFNAQITPAVKVVPHPECWWCNELNCHCKDRMEMEEAEARRDGLIS